MISNLNQQGAVYCIMYIERFINLVIFKKSKFTFYHQLLQRFKS